MKNEWKEVLRTAEYVSTDGSHAKEERVIRKAISELRKEGIIFIPVIPHFYIRAEEATLDDVEKFARSQFKAIATQYFNTVKPLRDRISDEKLRSMMGHLDFLEQSL